MAERRRDNFLVLVFCNLAYGRSINLMVYGPGGCKFNDFIKIGIPMTVDEGIIANIFSADTVPKKIFFFSGVLAILLMVALFFFVFNPQGLGPEPQSVLPSEFFANPAQDLSELELLVDGKEAFNEIFTAIDSAESSVYIQTYIWKDDSTGQSVVTMLKAAADRGVGVTVSKDMLGTFFELSDMIQGKPSPVFTKFGLKRHKNIQVDTNIFADTDHSKYCIFDERSVIFGGMNIADEYHLQWHDYMVLIRGKAWTEAFTNKVLKLQPWPRHSPLVLTVNNSKETEIRTATIEIIDHAKNKVVVEHAYFSDDKVIEDLLFRAVMEKPEGHHINENVFKKCSRTMSLIGG
jgi:hypothetical protein